MEIFDFFSWAVAALVTVTALWPLNVPLAVLAYRIHHGERPRPLDGASLWQRAAGATLALLGFSLVLVALSYLAVGRAELPAGPVHLVLFLLYVPAGAWLCFVLFALDEPIEGLSIFLIYVLLPGIPLMLAHWFLPHRHLLGFAARVLSIPTSGEVIP